MQAQVKKSLASGVARSFAHKTSASKPDPVSDEKSLLLEEIEVLRAHNTETVEAHLKAAKLAEKETALMHKERQIVAVREKHLLQAIDKLQVHHSQPTNPDGRCFKKLVEAIKKITDQLTNQQESYQDEINSLKEIFQDKILLLQEREDQSER